MPATRSSSVLYRIAWGLVFAASASAQTAPASTGMRELARQVALDDLSHGVAAEREGRAMAAEAWYRQAFDADAGYLPPYLANARLLAARGHVDDALRVLHVAWARAVESDRDAIDIARARGVLGDVDGALGWLTLRSESADAARARAELAAAAGRFPEALLAARRAMDLARGTDGARTADTLARALGLLVGDADAVRAPGAGAPALRRMLAR